MNSWISFAIIGFGLGALYSALGVGLVVTFKGTGVINFAAPTSAAWGAFTYAELRSAGNLVIPVVGFKDRVHVAQSVGSFWALAIALFSAVLLGALIHFLVFRPLAGSPTLAKVVASVGTMIVLQGFISLKFGSETKTVTSLLPDRSVELFGSSVPQDRLWLAAVALALAAMVGVWLARTRLGLAICGASENELAASLAGFSPQRLALLSWIISTLITTLMFILVSPITGLNPTSSTLLIVPALAVGLVGRLTSISKAAIAGLFLGAFQSVVSQSTSQSWFPTWAIPGAKDVVPFVVIVGALFIVGQRLPKRGDAIRDRLPELIVGPRSTKQVLVATCAASLLISVTSGSYRFAIINTMIGAIIALSLVVLTGLVGQISLAQAAIAGTSGFVLSKIGSTFPFPFDLVVAALVATVLGTLLGIPALRIRGAQLAVVTMAGAVAIEQLVFRNPRFSPPSGNPIRQPSLFGMSFAVRSGNNIARVQFAFLVLVVLVGFVVGVGNLMRSTTGRSLLAVRANERAAASVGINVSSAKLLAFASSSFIAGVGGALMGYSRGQLSADSFGIFVGVSFLAFAYLGGISSVSGALVAGTFIPLGINHQLLTNVIGSRVPAFDTYYFIIGGLGLILAATTNPDGLAGASHRRRRSLTNRNVGLEDRSSDGPRTRPAQRAGTRPSKDQPNETKGVGLLVENLSVQFGGLTAVNSMSISVPIGRIVGLIGPNGAGKTTFIDAITGFVPSTGRVVCRGVELTGLPAFQRSRAGLARTWQSVELFDELNVRANVMVGAQQASFKTFLRDVFRSKGEGPIGNVEETLALLGLSGEVNRRPSELSLGQQKLVGVARALAMSPAVLLLDEPAAGLDEHESAELGERLLDVAKSGVAILLIDHDMSLMFSICDDLAVMESGSLIACDQPELIRNDKRVASAYLGDQIPVVM
jgi:ABC-type branched-subunit amino acid transport system ATPase component/ABC-type branched-subunit amino acid transport system permease subunit